MFKYFKNTAREYIFIILTATIFYNISILKCLAEQNIFVVDNVKIKTSIDINFSRNKYIDEALLISFKTLMPRILLSEDLNKIKGIKLDKIKKLIKSFQILEESYRNNEYKATFKILYNDIKVKELLGKKNISFSQPKKISAVFFPILFINEEIQDFYNNFFLQKLDGNRN